MNEASIILTILFFIAAANGYVTYRVATSDYFDSKQKYLQCALIWIVPVIGAIACYVFSRDSTNSHSGKYPEERPYDFDGASGNYLGGDSSGGGHGGHGGEVGD